MRGQHPGPWLWQGWPWGAAAGEGGRRVNRLVRTVRQPALLVEQGKQALRLAEEHRKRGRVVWRVRVMIKVLIMGFRMVRVL